MMHCYCREAAATAAAAAVVQNVQEGR